MLHNGHELEGIVPRLVDSRQDVVGKLPVGTDLALLLRHANVGLIDIQLVLAGKALVRPRECLTVIHHLALEGDVLLVLHHPAGIQGDVLRAGQVGVHHSLDLAAVPQGVVAGEIQLPVSVAQIGQRVGGLVPAVEFALQIQLVGAGRPLPVVPAAIHVMEAKVHVSVGKIIQALSLGQNTFFCRPVQVHPQINIPGERLKLGIQIQNTIHSVSFSAKVLSIQWRAVSPFAPILEESCVSVKDFSFFHFSRYKRLQYERKGAWKLADQWRSRMDEKTVKKYACFVVLTHEDKSYWGDLPNIMVIPNALTYSVGQPAPLNNKKVIAIGRYNYQKGFDYLIDAWAVIHRSQPEWKLDIIGDGEWLN